MLSGGQAGPLFEVVDAGLVGIHYYDSKTKIVVFYSLSNALDLISGN